MTGQEIRARRQTLGLSQEELGDLFGVTGSTVARWEAEKLTPSAPGMMSLAFETLDRRSGKGVSASQVMTRAERQLNEIRALFAEATGFLEKPN